MRIVVGAALVAALSLGCHSYVPPPLAPSSAVVSPVPTPTPAPPPALEPFSLSLYVSPSNVVRGKATNLILSVTGNPTAPLTFGWTFGDGSTGSTTVAEVRHTYTTTGTFKASVQLVDAEGRSGTTTTTIQVQTPPPGPTPPPPPPPPPPSYAVTLSASPSSLVVGDSATLTATATALNGAPTPTSYAWDCTNDGTTDATTAGNTHVCAYPTAGSITSRVTVTGGTATGSGTTTVTVAAAAPLYVNLTADDSTPAIDQDVIFTGTVTSAGAIPATFQWAWDFDHTATSSYTRTDTGASPHSTTFDGYGSVGVRTVQVLVTDPATGRTATGTRTVTVGP